MSLINFVYWMFIDLEIGLLSVCVFRSGCAHFLFLFIFLFLLDTSIVALCLFPLNSANKRRTNEFAPEKNEHFTCFLSLAMCLFLSRWCCCLIGLHVSITRKSFGFEQANNRWDACRCFARKKRRFNISFFDEFWSGCRFDDRRPSTIMFVATNYVPKLYVIYHFADTLWRFRID